MLVPLAIREPATVDKDDHWGLCDDPESSEDRLSSKQRKKDSGYCETFGNWLKQSEQEKVSTFSHIQRTISAHSHYKLPLSLRQLASLHSSNTISSQFMDSNNSYRRNSSPVSLRLLQQQQQQQQYHQQQLRHSYDCNSNTNSSSSNRAKFVGGEILAIMEEAELKYGNRGFLFNDFYVISVTPAQELASQFTFIEAELFRKIQPRDFLRHLYSNKTKTALFALVEHFNFVSAWIASFIVRQNELSKRIIVFEYCLKIATVIRYMYKTNQNV
jgi:hypothetical protein